jgi:hypothetical protein
LVYFEAIRLMTVKKIEMLGETSAYLDRLARMRRIAPHPCLLKSGLIADVFCGNFVDEAVFQEFFDRVV